MCMKCEESMNKTNRFKNKTIFHEIYSAKGVRIKLILN